MSEEKKKPVFKVKVGSIEAAAWEQAGKEEGQTFLTVSTARNYKDGEEWKKTNTLRVNDIPAMKLALDKCYEFAKIKADEEKAN